MTRRRIAAAAALVLGVVGLWQLGSGGWIYAKAALARTLLDRAWRATVAGKVHVRPWPWSDSWPVAKLRFPGRNRETTVLEGAAGASLAFGPGHLNGTPLPGTPGNSVIAGHRDTSFTVLGALKLGDPLSLQTTDGRWHEYRISGTAIVDATMPWRPPQPAEGASMLTLVTCWPLHAIVPGGPMRYLVFAEEAPTAP